MSNEEQRLLDISVKSTNGTATKEENDILRTWMKQQITEGKASFDKMTGMYTFDINSEHSLSYSNEIYQSFASGKDLKQTVQETRQNTAMTADDCYKTIMSSTSNRTELDKALSYYAYHYDEVNAIDEKDNTLRGQKSDLNIKNKVLSDDYMAEKLHAIAENESTLKAIPGTNYTSSYSKNFLDDFSGTSGSAVTQSSQKRAAEIWEALLGNSAFVSSDQEDFKLPDMGDYYLGNVETTYLEAVSKAYFDKKDAQGAANYIETIPEKTLGYYPDEDIYFLKAKLTMSDKGWEDGYFGGDFITLDAKTLSSSKGDATDALSNFLKDLASKTADYPSLAGSNAGNMFELKIAGISAPQPARWAREYNVPVSAVKMKGLEKGKDITYYFDNNYVVTQKWISALLKSDKIYNENHFVYINGKWHAAEFTSKGSQYISFRWLTDPGSDGVLVEENTNGSIKYKGDSDAVEDNDSIRMWFSNLLKKSNGEIYIRFEGTGITPDGPFPAAMSNALIDLTAEAQLKQMADSSPDMTDSGLNRIHVQNCRRYFGEVFIKVDSEYGDTYINIAKTFLTGDVNKDRSSFYDPNNVYYSDDYQGNHKSSFRLQSYDVDSKVYADAFFETIDKLDDRKEIQKEIHGKDWDDMLDWNVTIGDVTLFIPPVNIRMQTTTHSERMSVLRAKGSAVKTGQRMNRVLMMDIFFNEDKEINGYAYSTNLNDNSKMPVTYSMNGLRAIVSMFKFTPFLPISNTYINRTLGIDAVVFNALNISSVDNYPKLIHATITMSEFDWRIYMPDIVQLEAATTLGTAVVEQGNTKTERANSQNEEEDTDEETIVSSDQTLVVNQKYRNWFEHTINWQTFRYYYQRPLRRGDYLKSLNLDFNSEEYIYYTCGGLTSLIPMSFQDPGIKFYMANEDYLKEILKARYELLRTGKDKSNISFSDDQIKVLDAISSLNNDLQTLSQNSKFQQDLTELNSVMNNHAGGTFFSDVADAVGNILPDSYYNRGCITNSMSNNIKLLEPINTCLAQVDQITQSTRAKYNNIFESGAEYMSIIDKDNKTVSFAVALKIKEGALPADEMTSFKSNLSAYFGSDPFSEKGNWEGFWDNQKDIKENRIIIPISIDITNDITLGFDVYKPTENSVFKLNGNTAGMQLISTADSLKKKQSKSDGNVVPDVNALMNLVYDEYLVLDEESPGFLVTSWRATLTNKVAPIRSLSSDGFAPQYLGGEDTAIEVHIQTHDKQIATMLTAIPKRISKLSRTYHLVMPCVPLRIDSEFTKFLGVNEVTCEDAIISTEPGHPGMYHIVMNFISMDRTIREYEAATRRSINNSGWNYYGDSSLTDYGSAMAIGSVAGAVGRAIATVAKYGASVTGASQTVGVVASGLGKGAFVGLVAGALLVGLGHVLADYVMLSEDKTTENIGSGKEQSRKYKQYFEMKAALAEQDLYPDLELPTVKEMEMVGFHFVRYKFQDERVYVDPDFYFIYPVKLTSHIARELAIHGMEAGIADTTLTDATGACIKVQPNIGTGFVVTEENDKYKKQAQQSENRRQIIMEMKTDQKRNSDENIKKKSSVEMPFMSLLNLTMERDTWSVCDQIQCMFLERKFLQEVKTYEATVHMATAGTVNSTRGTSNTENSDAADQAESVQTAIEDEQGDIKNVTHTEGQFVYDELQPAVEAAEKLYDWLTDNTIENTIASMNVTAEKFFEGKSIQTGDVIITAIKPAVVAFLAIQEVEDLLSELKITVNDKFTSLVSNIIAAAACAQTGRKEFAGKVDSDDWKPDRDFVGVATGTGQNLQGLNEVLWKTDKDKWPAYYNAVVKKGIEFGYFRFKMYTKKELFNLLYKDEPVPQKPKEKNYEDGNINNDHFVLDPGYRSATVEQLEQYKGKCITSIAYATYAFMRLVCYWLCRLIYMRVFPNLSTDVLRSRANLEISIQDTQTEMLGKPNSEVMVQGSGSKLVSLRKYIDFFSKNMHIVDAGKFWTATVFAASEGNASIVSAIENRNYDALNAIIETCSTPSSKFEPLDNQGALVIRKMVLALAGFGIIENIETIGTTQTLPAVATDRDSMERLFLDAAEDPKQFIPHSFHDMIVHDARGRMLRAFPTFYMIFIDEGREIGFWKLHDNFYNVNSIASIEVVKSRRLPADVCTVVMSNFYNSFTTEQEDYVRTPVASLEQSWNSIFSPSEYFKEQEVGRRNKPQEIRLRLRQGARIHVRMGYGNNAAMLPVLFNGIITEVSSEESVRIIAQGDGVELLNPINIDKESHNLPNEDDIWGFSAGNGASPLQIACALFTTHGGFISEQIRERLKLNLTARNPFGIVHFGDPDFTTFCKTGECCQNLYEMTAKPLYAGNADMFNLWYTSNDITRITFDLFQKTPWDVLNICKSISPDHKLAVLPFGFRSTVFMGAPHFYYAYDYYKDENNVVKEKRKPFQQWHIYTAEQDIIGNGIVATNRDVKTVAVGLFQICETFNMKSQQKVGPIYADWDIFTEAQKTMVVDTSLVGKGVPFVGGITNLLSTLGIGTFDSGGGDALLDDTGFIASHKKIAWRSTVDALKNSVMEMYAGDLIVFGDPSIKPQDRMFISDKYSGISGQALVKETVHRISIDEGFTTAISPDCITVVNDNTELIKYEAMNRIGGLTASSACLAEDLAGSISWTSTVTNMAAWAALGAGAAKLTGVALTKAGMQALEWFGTSSTGQSIYARASNAVATARKGTAAAGSKIFSWLGTRLGSSALTSLSTRLAAVAAAGSVPILGQAAAVAYLAGTVASVLIMPFINTWIESELKNYKALTIYPLKKYGYAYTAGFEGARGTVYGSPTWGDRGSLGDVFDWLEDYPLLGTIGSLLFSDEVKELAAKYQKDNGIYSDTEETENYDEMAGRLLGHIAGADTSFLANTYRSQQLQPRATTNTPVAMTNSYNHFKKLDTKNWKNDLGQNRMISQDARIVPYIDDKFFLIVHETPGLPVDGKTVTEEVIDINGKKYRIKAVHTVDGNGNAVIDIPLLNRQALNILYEILRRARNYMPCVNSTDPNEHWEATKNDYITLKSALRIGDRTSMGCTGFTFVLEGTAENSQRALKAAIENLDAEFKSYSDKEGIQTDIFTYKQQDNGEISVRVTMPQVRGQDEGSNSTNQDSSTSTAKSDTTEEVTSLNDSETANS